MKNIKIGELLNEQMGKEFFSAYLYLSIANSFGEQNLDGFANWFEVQAKEELDHALLFRRYLLNEECSASLQKIEAPVVACTDLAQCLKTALKHEQMITESIHNIYAETLACKDYRTMQFLDWFIKEQGEEEKNASDLCKRYELFGKDEKSLYLMNAELLTRVYAPPTLTV